MSENTNLLYNGSFSQGTDTWSGSGLTVSDGVATLTGNLMSSTKIPVANGRTYRLSLDIKFNTIESGSRFYLAIIPYDNNKTLISMVSVYKPWNGTNTTLAAAIKNGDTTVSLTSGSGWTTDTYSRIGICDRLAWGYNRNSFSQRWTAISGNTLTLQGAWSGGSWPAGTKVAEFRSGDTYYYPWNAASNNLPTTWTTLTQEFNGGDPLRWGCQYISFGTLGYNHNYSVRNIRIECISDFQECSIIENITTPQILKTGVIRGRTFSNVGLDIRYIRDTTSGNSVNGNNHWNEIEVYNDVGENIAWGKTVTVNDVTYANSVATDGTVNSSYIGPGGGTRTMTLDLGFIEHINKIKIWHYYPDKRTYNNNITEVSSDGTNWITVYSGQKPESSDGNEIILTPDKMSIFKDGKIQVNDIIEW